MAKLILHIGTHKTASTTLQDTFFANRELLAQHGLIYPALGKHSGHHGLLSDWIALPDAYALPDGGIASLQNLAAKYVDSDVSLLISSEELSRGGGAGGRVDLAALAEIFAGFDHIEVICFLREQWQFLQSVYLETASNRTPQRPPALVETALQTGMVDGLWCDYRVLHDHLQNTLAPDLVNYVDFSTAKQYSGGVLGAMLALLGLPISVNDLTLRNAGQSNVSGCPLPIWAGFAIAGANPVSKKLFASVQTAFDLEYGENAASCIFTRSEVQRIKHRFSPLNAELADRIIATQPDFAVTSDVLAPEMIYREDLGVEFWVRAARRIYLEFPGYEVAAVSV